MKSHLTKEAKGFTIIESIIVLAALFVITMLLIALYLHHFGEDGLEAAFHLKNRYERC